jgi:hypothetical protein
MGFYLAALFSERWWLCLLYIACQIPAFLATWLPLSVLVAAMFTAGPMLRQGTLMALCAAGIPPSRIFRSFLLIGVVAGFAAAILADQAVTRCEPLSEQLKGRIKYWHLREGLRSQAVAKNIPPQFVTVPARVVGWAAGGDQWVAVQALPEAGYYAKVAVSERVGGRLVTAERMSWTADGWKLEDVDVLTGDHLTRFTSVAPAALGLILDEDQAGLAQRVRPDTSRTVAELHATDSPRTLAILCQRLAAGLLPLLGLVYGLPRFVRWESRGKLAVPALQAVAFALIPAAGLAIMGRLMIATGHRVEFIAVGMVGCLIALGWLRWRLMRL